MLLQNGTLGTNRWYCLTIVLTGCLIFSSCVGSTLNTTGSVSMTDSEVYNEIKAISDRLSEDSNLTAYETLVEKSRVFVKAYPKYEQVDEVYYLLGNGLIMLDRIEEAIEVLDELIRYYPAADYVEQSLLLLGLAYDKIGEHDKADPLYEKLVMHTKYRTGRYAAIAQQLLELDREERIGELANSAGASPAARPSQFINRPALDFQVTDLSGETLSLTQYRGQVVLLDFWATWCGPCIAEMPNVKATYTKYKNQKFEIIGISLDNSPAPLEAYIVSEGLTWRQYWDSGAKITQLYNVRAIPSTFLIDGSGVIREVNLRGAALENAVAELVRENLGN